MGSVESAGQRRRVPHWIIAALGYSISIACLVWVYHGFDWKQELPRVMATDWRWVTLAVISDICVYVIQGWRWNLLLRPVKRVPLITSVQAIYIGLFANEILPLRSGEVIRAYLQAKWHGLPFSVLLSSVAVERVLDGAWLALGFYLVLRDMSVPGYLSAGSRILVLILLAAGVLFALAVLRKTQEREVAPRSRWAAGLRHLVAGLHTMGRSWSFLFAAIISFLYLALQIVPVYALARGFGLSLSFGAATAVLIILRLGSIPPQAPGNVGTFQFFTIVGLRLFGITGDNATAFATLLFIVLTVPLWAAGFIALLATRMRLQQVHRDAREYLANGGHTGSAESGRNPNPSAAPAAPAVTPED